MVDLGHFQIDQVEQFLKLIFPLFQIWIHLLNLTSDSFVVIFNFLEFVIRHDSFRMVTINFATHTHGDITDFTEEFVLVLFVVVTKPEIQNRVVFDDFSVVFCGYLVFVMLVIAFFAKINFLSETVNVSFLVLAFLALYQFGFLVLLLSEGKLDQVVRKCLHFFEDFQPVSIDFILTFAFLIDNRVKPFRRPKVLRLSLGRYHARIALSGTDFNNQKFVILLCVLDCGLVKAIDLSHDEFEASFFLRDFEPFLADSLNSIGTVVLWFDVDFRYDHAFVLLFELRVHVWVDHAIDSL